MALHEGRDGLEARGATLTATADLSAHLLFGANAEDIVSRYSRPAENIQELELRVRAGNAQGMADGYFSSSQFLDEDGNVQTEEEKAKKDRQRIQRSMMATTSNYKLYQIAGLEVLPKLDERIATRDLELTRINNEYAALETKLDELDRNAEEDIAASQATVDAAQAAYDDAEEEAIRANLVRENAEKASESPLLAIGADDGNIYVSAMTSFADSPTGLVFIAQDADGNPCRDEDGNIIIRDGSDANILTSAEDKEAHLEGSTVTADAANTRLVLTGIDRDRVTLAHTELVSIYSQQRSDVLLQMEINRTEYDSLYLEQQRDIETRARIYDYTHNGPGNHDPAEMEELIRTTREGFGMAPIEESVAFDPSDPASVEAYKNELMGYLGAIETNISSAIDSAQSTLAKYESQLAQLEQSKSYLDDELNYINGEEMLEKIANGEVSLQDLESATIDYDPGYWANFYTNLGIDRPENMSVADPSIYSAGGMKAQINMSLPQGYIGEDGIWIQNDPYGIDAHIPAARNSVMSASADDGMGITNQSVTPKSDFSVAASGAPLNQSVADPAVMAQLQASLKTGTETQQVAMANTGAYTP